MLTNEGGNMSDFSVADELLKLKDLLDKGILTQKEFEQQKKVILNKEAKKEDSSVTQPDTSKGKDTGKQKKRIPVAALIAVFALGVLAGFLFGNGTSSKKGSVSSDDFKIVGSTVTFGSYEQDNDTSNGKEPLEWIVLSYQDGKSLLISKYGLDCQPYNTVRADMT